MRKYLLDLYEIQKIDLEIRNFEATLDAIPKALRLIEAQMAQVQAKIAGLAEQSSTTLSEAQTMQRSVEEEGLKIRKWESRLNDIRNQREFQALSRETEGSKRANRDSEERIVDLLRTKDRTDEELASLRKQLETLEAQSREEQGAVQDKSQTLQQTLEAQRQRREALVPRVPAALFRKYDAIARRRLGLGLAQVIAGCCQGCNMRLPPQLYNILQRGDTIEQCPSCHRLVFWTQQRADEDAASPTQSASV